MDSNKARDEAIKKLAQENARYVTSVFTPTSMAYTVNLRQLNFLQQQFEIIVNDPETKKNLFQSRLVESMKEFLEQTKDFRVEKLDNQTDRTLSFYLDNRLLGPSVSSDVLEDIFQGVYSISHELSFAGFAQAQRHRSINYNIIEGTELGAPRGFFIPKIVELTYRVAEWSNDLHQVAKEDLPQAQLLMVYERGILEDFRSKALLRMCGHAQFEIMQDTLEIAKGCNLFQQIYGKNSLEPKCKQGMKCASPCVWGGNNALQRLV